MATDIYALIDGITGEATDSKHQNWIEVLSFNHSISQPVSSTAVSAGGGTAARCDHADFSISKHVDAASPKLYELCSSGKHIPSVTIEMMRASGENRVKYMEVKMTEVVISHVAPSGAAEFPTESVAFNYGTIKWTYIKQQRKDGTGTGNVTGGWSLVENKVMA